MIVEKRTAVRALDEVTYGVKPALTDSHARYVENLSVVLGRDSVDRPGLAGGRAGWGSAAGRENPSLSMDVEIVPVSLDVGSAVTPVPGRPLHAPFLTALGFGLDASTANELVWTLLEAGHGSLALEIFRKGDDGVEGELWTALGTLFDGVLRWSQGERYMASLQSGICQALTKADDSTVISPVFTDEGYVATVLTPASRLPLVALGADVVINPTVGAVFVGDVIDFELRLRNNPTPSRRANGTGSISKVRLVPEGAPELDISIGAVSYAEFDPYALRDARTPMDISVTLEAVDAPSGTRDLHDTECTVIIQDIEERYEDGRLVWKLKTMTLWATPGVRSPLVTLRSRSIAA